MNNCQLQPTTQISIIVKPCATNPKINLDHKPFSIAFVFNSERIDFYRNMKINSLKTLKSFQIEREISYQLGREESVGKKIKEKLNINQITNGDDEKIQLSSKPP